MKANSHTYPTSFNKRRVGLSCTFKSLITLFLFTSLIFTKTFAQFNPSPGTAAVSPPTGGFGIDGDLSANGGIGDWIPGSGGGGNVLTSAGVPVNNTTTFHLIDRYISPDDNFAGGNKVNG